MVRRWLAAGHEVVVYDVSAETRETFAKETGLSRSSIANFVANWSRPYGLANGARRRSRQDCKRYAHMQSGTSSSMA